ncbi:hypothetical protein LCGC14_2425340 [marine sediment metagenome]|uniref:Uncharacterized protein n=1 Tax=marine sediment metagenome TaxID=412755 RepID=A0A0F9E0K8_9ZZZZ
MKNGTDSLKVMLVYQAGIANVFSVASFNLAHYGRQAIRLMQADFAACENFARGAGWAGAVVRSAYCDQAGDIGECRWSDVLEDAPFSESQRPIKAN